MGVFSSFSCSVSACSAADSLLFTWRVYNLSIVLRVRSGARERVRAVDRRAAKARRKAAGWGAARSQAVRETVPRKAPAALCEGGKAGARAAPPTPRVGARSAPKGALLPRARGNTHRQSMLQCGAHGENSGR